jgi:hypothetical protein
LIYFAWSAYLKVERVSSKLSLEGEIAQIIRVFEFPPNALLRILVKHESRYGTLIPFYPN